MGVADWPFDRLVGVIDLLAGQAVHAIAGQRAGYRQVSCCDGDAVKLVQYYLGLGIRSFYIADLDAICGKQLQATLLNALVSETDGDVIVDAGWSGSESDACLKEICRLVESHSDLGVIAATETANSPEALDRLVERVSADRIWLGLDFRSGELLVSRQLRDQRFDAEAELGADVHGDFCVDADAWIAHAMAMQIHRLVVLDIAAVGKTAGPVTAEMCCKIRAANPSLTIWSGGGIRDASDAVQLMQQGCERCLVATAMQGDV